MVSAMPAPKKKKAKKKKKAEDDDGSPSPAPAEVAPPPSPPPAGEDGGKKPVKKKKKKSPKKIKTPEPEEPIPDLTVKEALEGANTWNNTFQIKQKTAVGTLTTANYEEKALNFSNINKKVEDIATLAPASNYVG